MEENWEMGRAGSARDVHQKRRDSLKEEQLAPCSQSNPEKRSPNENPRQFGWEEEAEREWEAVSATQERRGIQEDIEAAP